MTVVNGPNGATGDPAGAPDLAAITALRATLWEHGYRPVPVRSHDDPDRPRAGKSPGHKDWPEGARRNPSDAAVTPAEAHLANTGILADGLRALDVDVDDFDRAEAIEQTAIRMLGAAPTRRRDNANRMLILYRAAAGEPRMRRLKGSTGDPARPDQIEILGRGQQFVAYGIHPSGGRLYWSGAEPLSLPRDQLPAITEAQLDDFLKECTPIIGVKLPRNGARPVSPPPQQSKPPGDPQSAPDGVAVHGTIDIAAIAARINQAQHARLLSALAAVPADDYDIWILFGCALHHAYGGSAEGRDIWDRWSATSDKYDPDEIEGRWASFATDADATVSIATIFHNAQQHFGWTPPGGSAAPEPPDPESPDGGPPTTPDTAAPAAQPGSSGHQSSKQQSSGQQQQQTSGSADQASATPPASGRFPPQLLGRPQLVMNDGNAQETLHELVTAMARIGDIYRQGDGDTQRGVVIRSLTEAEISALASLVSIPRGLVLPVTLTSGDVQDFAERHFTVVMQFKTGTRQADFRGPLAHRLMQNRLGALRPLIGISHTPILRRDGSLVVTPGYDVASQLWIVVSLPQLTLPEWPTRADAMAALECLDALLAEHPFEHPGDRVAALAILMTPALRSSMQRVPLVVADAAYARTGKDYLLGTAALIGTGFRPSVFTLSERGEEQQKRIGSALLLGAPVVSLNNVNGRLDSDELAAYLTEGGCITRAYATAGGVKYAPNGNVIVVSGNNVLLSGDLPERGLICRQDARLERPGDRSFRQAPHAIVQADRGKYLSAVFTVAKWALVGSDYQAPAMSGSGGFDDFDRIIRGPLLVLTGTDPFWRSRGELLLARQQQPDRDLIDALTALLTTDMAVSRRGRQTFAVRDIQAELRRFGVPQRIMSERVPDEADPFAALRGIDLSRRLPEARGRRGSTRQLIQVERPKAGADVAWYSLVPLPGVPDAPDVPDAASAAASAEPG